MDWVHCNFCAVQPGEVEKIKFFITNCGHIYCSDCFQPDFNKICRICQSKCNTISLSANMNSEIEVFFHDPMPNFKKYMKVLEFQHSHRLRLLSCYREKLRNYKAMKKENSNLTQELKLYKENNKRLLEEIQRMKTDRNEVKKSPFLWKESPKSASRSSLEDNSKRAAESGFFFVTEKRPASQPVKKDGVFTPPDLPKYLGDYRSCRMSMSDLSTPSTSDTMSKRFIKKRDPLQKKISLPSGPSPTSKLGIHGLHLSMTTSTPKEKIGILRQSPRALR